MKTVFDNKNTFTNMETFETVTYEDYDSSIEIPIGIPTNQSLVIKTEHVEEPQNCPLTTEETKNLSGMVANRLAMFEKNVKVKQMPRPKSMYKNTYNISSIQQETYHHKPKNNFTSSISANSVNRFLQNKFNVNSLSTNYDFIDSNKENSMFKPTETVPKNDRPVSSRKTDTILSSNIIKPAQRPNMLWSRSEETSKELNIPLSVKQAKLCFENMAGNRPQTKITISTPKSFKSYSRSFESPIEENHIKNQNLQLEIKQTHLNLLPSLTDRVIESPDLANLLSSSSTSSSISLASAETANTKISKPFQLNHILNTHSNIINSHTVVCRSDSSASSRENTPRPDSQSSQNSESSIADLTMSVEIKNQLKFKTSNIASKIKKLENKFSRNEDPLITKPQANLVSASLYSNDSISKSSIQSPKFLQLFQKQMDIGNNVKNTRSENGSEGEIELQETINKFKMLNNEDSKPIFRKMTSSSSIGSSSSSSSSSTNDSMEQKSEIDTTINADAKIDSAPCVLPSAYRNRPTPAVAAATISSHISKKMSNNQFVSRDNDFNTQHNFRKFEKPVTVSQSKPINWTTAAVGRNTGRSSGSTTSGFVKNNAAMFNRNSDPMGCQNFVKKTNRATTAREALVRWCRNRTVDYDNVSIENFSSSWSNGLAFCALLNHFLPDAFDYDSLDAKNPRFNFELAFKTAEDKAGVVPLLDVDDMIEMGNSPDWKCVFTYVHSIYQRFKETA